MSVLEAIQHSTGARTRVVSGVVTRFKMYSYQVGRSRRQYPAGTCYLGLDWTRRTVRVGRSERRDEWMDGFFPSRVLAVKIVVEY